MGLRRHGSIVAAIVLALFALGLSACALDPKPSSVDRTVLPAGRQPTLPQSPANAPAPLKTEPIKIPSAGFPLTISYRQNGTNGGAVSARLAMAKYDMALLTPTHSSGDDVKELSVMAPAQPKIVTMSPDTRPKGDRSVFPGHWLLYTGTKIRSDMAALDGVTLVSVDDASVFGVSNADHWPDDVLIYGLTEDGRPDWNVCEEAVIARIDSRRNVITLKRAQYGSRPREFIAGKAIIASHATRGRRDAASWVVNISRNSPVSPSGHRGAEAMARILVEVFRAISPVPHGIQLESSQWEVYQGSSNQKRGPDTDNDLKADWGQATYTNVGTVNAWGLGSSDLVRHLRDGGRGFQGLGTGIGIWVGYHSGKGSRAVHFANGIAYEDFDADARHGFSAAFQRLEVLNNAAAQNPRMSYVLINTPTTAFARSASSSRKQPLSNAPLRLGLGVALLQGMASGYASAEPGDSASLGWGKDYYLDEYNAGRASKRHYLGQPLNPMIRLSGTMKREDVLGGAGLSAAGFDQVAPGGTLLVKESFQTRRPSGVSVQIESNGKEAVRSGAEFDAKSPSYTVSFWAKATNNYGNLDPAYSNIPTFVELGLSHFGSEPQTIAVTQEWTQYNITFYQGKATSSKHHVVLKPNDPGVLWIQDLAVFEGTADVMYRLFEGGLVVVNGSNANVSLDIDMVAPGMKLRAIDGEQDKAVNNGRPVTNHLVIPALDARILTK